MGISLCTFLLLILSASIDAVSIPSFLQTPGGFADGSLCKPTLNDATGNGWVFDFSALEGLSTSIVAGAYSFPYSPCGTSNYSCIPQGIDVEWLYSPGVQVFSGNAPGSSCVSPVTGESIPCSPQCERLGQGPPLWSLLDSSNSSAGVAVTFQGTRAPWNDFSQCPVDPNTGTEGLRTIQLLHGCDPTIPSGQIKSVNAYENPECHYNVATLSSAACPTKAASGGGGLPPSNPPNPAPTDGSPYASYLCNPSFTVGASQQQSFNLTGLYSPTTEYTFTDSSSGAVFAFNLCGAARATCTPIYPVQYNSGASFVVTTSAPPSPQPDPPCQSANGTIVNCTGSCHVLGVGAPLWSLAIPGNLSGGIVGVFEPVEVLPADPSQCPINPYTSMPYDLTVALVLQCDVSLGTSELKVESAVEQTPCSYVVTASTGAVCGSA